LNKFTIILMILALSIYSSCKKKDINTSPIEQYNIDQSNDYRYIFKDDIEKEKWRKNRYKENDFKK
jgi:hypothetical protein